MVANIVKGGRFDVMSFQIERHQIAIFVKENLFADQNAVIKLIADFSDAISNYVDSSQTKNNLAAVGYPDFVEQDIVEYSGNADYENITIKLGKKRIDIIAQNSQSFESCINISNDIVEFISSEGRQIGRVGLVVDGKIVLTDKNWSDVLDNYFSNQIPKDSYELKLTINRRKTINNIGCNHLVFLESDFANEEKILRVRVDINTLSEEIDKNIINKDQIKLISESVARVVERFSNGEYKYPY